MLYTIGIHAVPDPSVAFVLKQTRLSGGSEPYYTLSIGCDTTLFLTPNQALALRDALASNPELATYETDCEKEEAGREQGPCVGDVEYSSEVRR